MSMVTYVDSVKSFKSIPITTIITLYSMKAVLILVVFVNISFQYQSYYKSNAFFTSKAGSFYRKVTRLETSFHLCFFINLLIRIYKSKDGHFLLTIDNVIS